MDAGYLEKFSNFELVDRNKVRYFCVTPTTLAGSQAADCRLNPEG
jgi:hypothetical protein